MRFLMFLKVASKLNTGLDTPERQRQFQPSEFTRKVSRGLLKPEIAGTSLLKRPLIKENCENFV